jgi:hypothetical protein
MPTLIFGTTNKIATSGSQRTTYNTNITKLSTPNEILTKMDSEIRNRVLSDPTCHSDTCDQANYYCNTFKSYIYGIGVPHSCRETIRAAHKSGIACSASCVRWDKKVPGTAPLRDYSKYREQFSRDLEVVFTDAPFKSALYFVAQELAKPQQVREWEELCVLLAGLEGLYKKSDTGVGIRKNIMSFLRPRWDFAREIAIAHWGLGRVLRDEDWCSCVYFANDSHEPQIDKNCRHGKNCVGLGITSWSCEFDYARTNWTQLFCKMIRTNWQLRHSGKEQTCVECGDYVESMAASRCTDCFYSFMEDDDRYYDSD